MTSVVYRLNAMLPLRFRQFFRPRDFFFHDGASFRSVHVSRNALIGLAGGAILLAAWSIFAAIQLFLATPHAAANAQVTAMQTRVARMEADYAAARQEAAVAAARIEQRQKLIGAIVAGTADADALASLLPAEGDLIASGRARALVAPLDRVAHEQLALVDKAQETADSRYSTMVSQLRKLGLDPRRFHIDTRAAKGGPYEAAAASDRAGDGDPQFRALFQSWKKLDQLQQGVMAVPSQRPVRNIVFSSPFGVRSDPFRGSAAMHSGIDLAGPMGSPIYATADGVVSRAGWANGYGNLVELEHGKGIETRYGHLSKILVRPGQRVKRGDLIAKMGSTGRSTGSHLHYEVRLDGHAVNPLPFLQSADYLAAIQRRAQATQVAMGGPE
jgi:murein DD-endopeptidase MepM/ murein hydrolase activator NlpD